MSCDNDDYPYSEVPSVVLNEFMAEYSKASDVDFKPKGENYEVEFEIDGNDHKALINSSGNLLREKKEISWNELPIEVRETLNMELGKKDIKNLELVRWGTKIFYQAEVDRFLVNEEVVLDKTGKQDPKLNFWK